MRKITEIKAIFSKTELLAANQIVSIKGGLDVVATTTTILSVVKDDKRRARPGGGASTQ